MLGGFRAKEEGQDGAGWWRRPLGIDMAHPRQLSVAPETQRHRWCYLVWTEGWAGKPGKLVFVDLVAILDNEKDTALSSVSL